MAKPNLENLIHDDDVNYKHSNSRVYIQNLFVYEKKITSNFVLESLKFLLKSSDSDK